MTHDTTEAKNTEELAHIATFLRAEVIKMVTAAGSGHPGGSLSAADIMAALWFGGALAYRAQDPLWPGRDRFVLSKGHAAPVLYATLAQAGFFEQAELATLRQLGSRLQGHPDCLKLPGVEVSTGSLGQGLSIATGMALGLKGGNQRVFCLLGDGECQEGQVWEAALYAAQCGLSHLVALVDNNNLQIDGHVSEICSLGTLARKFEEFGWYSREVDGHDLGALGEALAWARELDAPAPRVIVAHTIKGKGVSFMEDKAGWHGKAPSAEECSAALAELLSDSPVKPLLEREVAQ